MVNSISETFDTKGTLLIMHRKMTITLFLLACAFAQLHITRTTNIANYDNNMLYFENTIHVYSDDGISRSFITFL